MVFSILILFRTPPWCLIICQAPVWLDSASSHRDIVAYALCPPLPSPACWFSGSNHQPCLELKISLGRSGWTSSGCRSVALCLTRQWFPSLPRFSCVCVCVWVFVCSASVMVLVRAVWSDTATLGQWKESALFFQLTRIACPACGQLQPCFVLFVLFCLPCLCLLVRPLEGPAFTIAC